ncbi:hypothetical protein PGTUg99_037160 [Puccinia graminis f. sp. tritici]|uniref:Uncharacterized protein n=1 Tax=Puccinia graminis f. sp. tritici TaxID=56615 RepID=A0A5B0SR58_PUCGR|nr:hypothetical protein PGTUg99_037160 [Puccinia graminis f. sp. tritici]
MSTLARRRLTITNLRITTSTNSTTSSMRPSAFNSPLNPIPSGWRPLKMAFSFLVLMVLACCPCLSPTKVCVFAGLCPYSSIQTSLYDRRCLISNMHFRPLSPPIAQYLTMVPDPVTYRPVTPTQYTKHIPTLAVAPTGRIISSRSLAAGACPQQAETNSRHLT